MNVIFVVESRDAYNDLLEKSLSIGGDVELVKINVMESEK